MNNILIQYSRNRRGQLNGCVLAVGPNKLGWSLCRKGDKFTKKHARASAWARAILGTGGNIPHSLESIVPRMKERSVKYFK